MEEKKTLSFYNTIINHKNKHQNPLYLTWNKFKKYNSKSPSNKNIKQSMNIKTLNNLNYYKDPFFLNDFNLRNQLEILKAINNEKVDLSKNFMEENLPTIYNITHNNMFSKTHNTDINDYYNRVFKMKPLFRKIKPVVDNKLNMRYAENEEQYRKIMEKEHKILVSQGKKIKSKTPSDYIITKVDDLKTRIRFMKGIIDFSYPGFVLTKIKAIDKKLRMENETRYKLKDFHSPVETRNIIKNKRNRDRKAYLYECFNIKTSLNKYDENKI